MLASELCSPELNQIKMNRACSLLFPFVTRWWLWEIDSGIHPEEQYDGGDVWTRNLTRRNDVYSFILEGDIFQVFFKTLPRYAFKYRMHSDHGDVFKDQ
ncbi:unnamed protein product [Cuscuta campestris]|uniref:Uncharacterized protein n=1 Tax=Cuscuta campestris TaxID=132261 RepID=A0A484KTB5_9ASTE|nr:unnamed protein product [Cuscuta campestris]